MTTPVEVLRHLSHALRTSAPIDSHHVDGVAAQLPEGAGKLRATLTRLARDLDLQNDARQFFPPDQIADEIDAYLSEH